MVHFIDEDDSAQLKLEECISTIANINDRVSYMDKLEGLNRDFQTKVRRHKRDLFLRHFN
jgi:hypothetical protein